MGPASIFTTMHDEPDALYGYAARSSAFHRMDLSTAFRCDRRRASTTARSSPPTTSPSRSSGSGEGSSHHRAAAARFRGRGGGGRRNARSRAFAPKRARDVRCSWRSFRSSRAPTTRATISRRRRLDPPLGSGPYKIGRFHRDNPSNTSASRAGGTPTCRCGGPAHFDTGALRIFPRARDRVRRLHLEELPVPRGIHVSCLGHTL